MNLRRFIHITLIELLFVLKLYFPTHFPLFIFIIQKLNFGQNFAKEKIVSDLSQKYNFKANIDYFESPYKLKKKKKV